MEGPWERFQQPSEESGPWTQFAAQSASAPTQSSGWGNAAADVAKSFGSGVSRGVSGLIGLPATIGSGVDWTVRNAPRLFGGEALEKRALPGEAYLGLPTSGGVQSGIESVIPAAGYQPQTRIGKYAHTVGEFIPGAVAAPGGGMIRNAVNFGVVPGIASEAAGQLTEGTSIETPARIGAGLLAGGLAAAVNRPGSAPAMLEQSAPKLSRSDFAAAEKLWFDAEKMGTPITWAEAVQGATGGATRMGNLQRVVEGQGGLQDFFAGRTASNAAAARKTFDSIAPQSNNPSSIGPAVGKAAEATANDVRGLINTASEPFYDAAALVRMPARDMQRIKAAPGWQEASQAVRSDPQLARYVNGLADDQVGFLNEVKKYLDTAADNAAAPVNAGRNMQRSAGYGSDATLVREAAVRASPDYARALQIQQQGRERFLDPLLNGPIGQIAKKDTTTKQAIDALFPTNPLPGSSGEVTTAVQALSRRNPWAAQQLVRAHAERTFNEAAQNLQSGANQFGGASFAATIRGNAQQAQNLEAAVKALPNGDQTWKGFNKLLDVFEAQGTRQRIGSQTAFNQEMQAQLKRGGLLEGTGKVASGGMLQWPRKALETVENWRMGRNVDQLASMLTDPKTAGLLQRLAESGGARGNQVALQIALVGGRPLLSPEKRAQLPAKR